MSDYPHKNVQHSLDHISNERRISKRIHRLLRSSMPGFRNQDGRCGEQSMALHVEHYILDITSP